MRRLLLTLASLTAAIAGFGQGNMPKMPENVAYHEFNYNVVLPEGRSYNHAPTFFIYPDTRVDEAGAKALVEEFDMSDVIKENHVGIFVINPVGEKYNKTADFEGFKEVFNKAKSGNLKVIGVGNGATFINTVLAPTDAAGHIAGILAIDGKPGKTPALSWGVPAYIAGKNASKSAKPYITMNKAVKNGNRYVNPDEELLAVVVDETSGATLAETFDKAWDEILVRNLRFNNYKHTHYEGAKYGQYGPYELEPYTVHESLGIKREAVVLEQRNALPWLWYEYWPEELIEGAPEKSVPIMVLLHGNTNDPRTQAETSGFIQVAGKERFLAVEMEWQGSREYGVMGYDGVEQVINMLLNKYPQLDPSRVYAQGLSAGSITATALGIRKSYVFAAVGGNCGGIYSGARTGRFSNFDSLWADATQKRGAVEMPYCSMLGTSDMVVPFYTKENYKGNNYLNAWNTYKQMNGMEVTEELDFTIDPLFGLELSDRQTIVTNKGEGIKIETGYMYKGNVPLINIIAVVDYGHWNFMPAAQMMWDYFKMFSRDPQTKKLIYHGKSAKETISCHQDPVNPNATPEAKALLSYLYKNVEEGKIVSGLHHNHLVIPYYFRDLDRIEEASGQVPMIWGGDLAWDADQVVEIATREHGRGRIVTIMWHVNRPFDRTPRVDFKNQTQGKFTQEQWDELVTEGTKMHSMWLEQVDSISTYLKTLQKRNIPVLWRPYHEMNGEWFWWGDRRGENGFKKLWIMLYDRMVNYHHLDNLIWVWNANAPRVIPNDTAMAYDMYYPGHEYVDVLATDVYHNDWKQEHHDQLVELGEGKLVALGELGDLPTVKQMNAMNKFAWFMIWTGFSQDRYNTLEELEAIFNMERTINHQKK